MPVRFDLHMLLPGDHVTVSLSLAVDNACTAEVFPLL